MSTETEKEKVEKEVKKKLAADRLLHEVDGRTRREQKLFNWEFRKKKWRLRVAIVKHPREGEEIYFKESNKLGRPIAVRAKEKGGLVSVLPTSTITCIIIRCCLKVGVPMKVLEALGGANPFQEPEKNIVRRVDLGLFFQRRQSFLWAASFVAVEGGGKGDDPALEEWVRKVKVMDGWPTLPGDDSATAALDKIVLEWNK